MNPNVTAIKIELEIAAERVINQLMVNNEKVENEIREGVKSALESFDFKVVVENAIKSCIESAIKSSTEWGAIRKLVSAKTDEIVNQYIENSLTEFKVQFSNSQNQKG